MAVTSSAEADTITAFLWSIQIPTLCSMTPPKQSLPDRPRQGNPKSVVETSRKNLPVLMQSHVVTGGRRPPEKYVVATHSVTGAPTTRVDICTSEEGRYHAPCTLSTGQEAARTTCCVVEPNAGST